MHTYKCGESNDVQASNMPEKKDLKKFYDKRYYLFSKFDRGILLDDESNFCCL
jgi:hypothetical protein